MKKSITSILLVFCALFSMIAPAYAETDWFLVHYPDPHFDLSNEPNRTATVEEFITYVTAKAYYSHGSNNPQVADKNGKMPSAWCGKYVQSEIDKKVFDPQTYAYSEPATVAFAAEYLSRCKGKYHWDYENNYNFTYTSPLTPEQQMYLNVAADYHLIPYTTGMSAMQVITRSQLSFYSSILSNKNLPTVTVPKIISNNSMKELHYYFPNSDYDSSDDIRQLQMLKEYSNDITMVSFSTCNISSQPNNGIAANGNLSIALPEDTPPAPRKYLRHFLNTEPIREAIAYCNENGILPLFGVGNFNNGVFDSNIILNMLSSESNMNTAISEIMWVLKNYNLKGVNIGFEHVSGSGRDNFTRFLTKLNAELDKNNMILLTTIGAHFRADQEKIDFYDYKAIGRLSDYVHIILYDDHASSAYNANPAKIGAGPMSSMNGVDRVMKYATHCMPSGKILLGLSTFGVDYNITTKHAMNMTRQELLPKATNGITTLTDGTEGGMFKYTDAEGNHEVYLESVQGIQNRLMRMYRYNLAGASVFYLESEFPELLEYARSICNYKPEVMSAAKAGLIPNNMRNLYNTPITRAQFCDIIALVCKAKSGKSINELLTEKGVSVNPNQFKDTSSPNVLAAAALGIVNGREGGNFAPNDTITRREAAAMLTRLAQCFGKSANGAGKNFSDISAEPDWAKQSIAFVSSITDPTNGKNIMGGTGKNMFSPYQTYTREQTYMTTVRLLHAL